MAVCVCDFDLRSLLSCRPRGLVVFAAKKEGSFLPDSVYLVSSSKETTGRVHLTERKQTPLGPSTSPFVIKMDLKSATYSTYLD